MTSVPAHIGLDEVLELTRDHDARKRKWAVRQLCPCHLKYNDDQVWDRLIAMAADDDPRYGAPYCMCCVMARHAHASRRSSRHCNGCSTTPTWACAAASARCWHSTGGVGPSTFCNPPHPLAGRAR